MSIVVVLLFAGSMSPGEISLEPDLVLGYFPEDDQEWIFTTATRLAASSDGTIFVLNPSDHQVLVFDPEGRQIANFGKRGPGPGEFSEPVAIALDRDNRIYVFDAGFHKLSVFDAEGRLLREKRFARGIHGIYQPEILDNGNIAFMAYKLNESFQVTYDFSIYSPELEPVKHFHAARLPKTDWKKPRDNSFWVSFLVGQLNALVDLPVHARVGNRLVAGTTGAYKGKIYGADGQPSGSYARKVKPVALSDEAKAALCEPVWQDLAANPSYSAINLHVFKKAVAEADLPTLPPVHQLFSLGQGFAALSNMDPETREGSLDVFDQNGAFLTTAPYKGATLYLHGNGDRLYAIGYDKEDNILIRRFRVKGL